MAGKILLLLAVGAIFSIYIGDMLGCILDPSSASIFRVLTFTALLIGTITGTAILKIRKK